MSSLTVVILAAGEGKRMNSAVPKVLHKFDSVPMLVRIIKTVKTIDPKKIVIVTGKYEDLIKQTISEYMNAEELCFIKQQVPRGTGDAIKSCLPYFHPDDNVLILNGDTPLITSNILVKFIKDTSPANLIVAKINHPFGYGRIVYDESDCFKEIIEEKECDEMQKKINIINSGIYLIKGSLLIDYIPQIENTNSQKEYYLTDIFKLIKTNTIDNIRTCLLDESEAKYIRGANTQEELMSLYD